MSDYRKKANFKDNIIILIVVLAILGGAIYFIVQQFSEVDLSKKELEDLRAQIKLEEVALLNKQDEWERKLAEYEEDMSLKQEEMSIEEQNLADLKAKFQQDIDKEKAKFSKESTKELERAIRTEYDLQISQFKEKQSQLNNKVKLLESRNKKLNSENSKLKKNVASLQQWKSKAEKLNREAKLAALKAKANDDVLVLMNKFAKLDVDLKKPDWCDKAYTARYNQASNLLDAIKAMIKKYDLSDNYKAFVSANAKSSSNAASEGWCNGVKVQ